MTTYESANDYLGAKADRPLPGKSTRIQRRPDGGIAIKYHATDVVTYYPSGRIVMANGGYQTSTTKARINEYTPVRVWANRGMWYAASGGGDWAARTARAVVFADGLTYRAFDGTLTGGINPATLEPAKRRLDRDVRKYIKGFCASVAAAQALDNPNGGDCWGCLFSAPEHEVHGRTGIWGTVKAQPNEPLGYSHYLTHFGGTEEQPEPYYVPSMVWKALQTCGNPAYVYQLLQAEATRGRTDMLRRYLSSHFRKLKPALLKEYR